LAPGGDILEGLGEERGERRRFGGGQRPNPLTVLGQLLFTAGDEVGSRGRTRELRGHVLDQVGHQPPAVQVFELLDRRHRVARGGLRDSWHRPVVGDRRHDGLVQCLRFGEELRRQAGEQHRGLVRPGGEGREQGAFQRLVDKLAAKCESVGHGSDLLMHH
jgi:hypothetical protein